MSSEGDEIVGEKTAEENYAQYILDRTQNNENDTHVEASLPEATDVQPVEDLLGLDEILKQISESLLGLQQQQYELLQHHQQQQQQQQEQQQQHDLNSEGSSNNGDRRASIDPPAVSAAAPDPPAMDVLLHDAMEKLATTDDLAQLELEWRMEPLSPVDRRSLLIRSMMRKPAANQKTPPVSDRDEADAKLPASDQLGSPQDSNALPRPDSSQQHGTTQRETGYETLEEVPRMLSRDSHQSSFAHPSGSSTPINETQTSIQPGAVRMHPNVEPPIGETLVESSSQLQDHLIAAEIVDEKAEQSRDVKIENLNKAVASLQREINDQRAGVRAELVEEKSWLETHGVFIIVSACLSFGIGVFVGMRSRGQK